MFVQPTGTRSWVQRLVIRGRRRELGLGAATLVPLATAREQALANRMLARSGGNPLSDKRRVQGVPTFAEASQRVLEQKRGGWRGRWHAQNWWRSMQRYVFPRIGNRPVSEIDTAAIAGGLSLPHDTVPNRRANVQRERRTGRPERAGVVIRPGEGPKAAGGDAGRKLPRPERTSEGGPRGITPYE